MKKLLKVFLSMMLLLFSVWAQAQTVSGTVTDVNGETIPGVSVLEKGTVQVPPRPHWDRRGCRVGPAV